MRNILLLLVLVILYGCPTYDPPKGVITIHNYSDSAVYVYLTCSDSLQLIPRLSLFEKWNAEVTDHHEQKIDPIYSPNYRINPYSYSEFNVGGTVNKPKLFCMNDTIYLFFIEERIMRTRRWEDICKHQLFEKKVILTEEQLKGFDWKFTYYTENMH